MHDRQESPNIEIRESDYKFKTCRGSGPGGQHRNKTDTAVQLTHYPTGIQIQCCSGKSQKKNKDMALNLLKKKLSNKQKKNRKEKRNKNRQNQIGTGMRCDKIRTIQCQNNLVVNHKTGKKISFKKYQKGILPK